MYTCQFLRSFSFLPLKQSRRATFIAALWSPAGNVITFPCDILGQMWYLIISITNICLFTLLSAPSKSMFTKYCLTACSSLPRKKVWLCELTSPHTHTTMAVEWDVKQNVKTNQGAKQYSTGSALFMGIK